MLGSKSRAVFLFFLVLVFAVLLAGGYLIDRNKPPIPGTVQDEEGNVLYQKKDVLAGQEYYFSRGGQHIGSIWGHGSYLAPDWSADYLHRMGLYLAARHMGKSLEEAAHFTQTDFDAIDKPTQARLSAEVATEAKINRYNAGTDSLVFIRYQAEAYRALVRYYTDLFKNGNEAMGLQPGIVRTDEQGAQVAAFFSWLAWSAGTLRPDKDYTYTSNWPYDPLVGNRPLPDTLIWSIVSVILLILFIALMMFTYLRYVHEADYSACEILPFTEPDPTPSQKATLAFFLVAAALLCVQIFDGCGHRALQDRGNQFFRYSLGGHPSLCNHPDLASATGNFFHCRLLFRRRPVYRAVCRKRA